MSENSHFSLITSTNLNWSTIAPSADFSKIEITMKPWAEREARRIGKAQTMIGPAVSGQGGVWADLGCGDGIFTSALHTMLTPDHEIYAVDKSNRALKALTRNFAESYPAATIHPIRADFTRPLTLPPLNGLLMANSLHFIKQKPPLLRQLVRLLRPGGRFVLIEYNTNRGNWAVPHPLDEFAFLDLAGGVGLEHAAIVAKIPSTFLGEMYAGLGLNRN